MRDQLFPILAFRNTNSGAPSGESHVGFSHVQRLCHCHKDPISWAGAYPVPTLAYRAKIVNKSRQIQGLFFRLGGLCDVLRNPTELVAGAP